MSPQLISTIVGLFIAIFTLGQVAPSILQSIQGKQIETGAGREETLVQQILQYRTLEGAFPATMQDLITKGYWRNSDNNNGFGGSYTFAIDSTRGLMTISTTIADSSARSRYINSYQHVFRPLDAGNGVVSTMFVMPSTGTFAVPLPTAGTIVASTTAPNAATNTYWYDTSSTIAVLKVSNGSTWVPANDAFSAPNSTNIVASISALPATANIGDIRYTYSNTGDHLTAYVWYGSTWVPLDYGAMTSSQCPGGNPGSGDPISIAACILTTYVVSGNSCAWMDGFLATDAASNYYACQNLPYDSVEINVSPGSCLTTGRVTYDQDGNTYLCSSS